jgi:hypothetical protein
MTKDLYAKLNLPQARIHVRDAGFWRRLAAFVLDLLLLDSAVFLPFSSFFSLSIDYRALLHGAFHLTSAMYAAAIVMALLALVYFMLFEYLLGQTPGMMLFNIRAENVTLLRAFVRNLFLLPVFPFPLLIVVEPLHLLWRKTRFLEWISSTRTVERIAY